MDKWVHRLINKNLEGKTANCSFCGKVRIVCTHSGKQTIWRCVKGRKMGSRSLKGKENLHYRKYFMKLNNCSCKKCGIENQDFRFFDVNHIDGDHDNNFLENLELLCPNCHRIETLKQWEEKRMSKWNKKSGYFLSD